MENSDNWIVPIVIWVVRIYLIQKDTYMIMMYIAFKNLNLDRCNLLLEKVKNQEMMRALEIRSLSIPNSFPVTQVVSGTLSRIISSRSDSESPIAMLTSAMNYKRNILISYFALFVFVILCFLLTFEAIFLEICHMEMVSLVLSICIICIYMSVLFVRG